MSKFKVGDRVVVVKDELGKGYWLLRRGQITAEYEEEHLDFRVLFGDGETDRFTSDELELESVYDALSKKPVEVEIDVKASENFKADLNKVMLFDEPKVALRDDDPVSHPSHYTSHPSGIECIEITKHMGFLDGNAMKYLWRYSLKNGVEDLYKCRQYLDWLIEAEEAKRG